MLHYRTKNSEDINQIQLEAYNLSQVSLIQTLNVVSVRQIYHIKLIILQSIGPLVKKELHCNVPCSQIHSLTRSRWLDSKLALDGASVSVSYQTNHSSSSKRVHWVLIMH